MSEENLLKEKFKEIKNDKLIFILLVIVIILGIFTRVQDTSGISYWGDDESTIPVGLLFFYPHTYFPGLSGVSEPPLGNLIIASGCMLSGEDFSKVTEIQPSFYPGRELLLGEPLINAQDYCHAPIILFGILFFLAVIVIAILLLNRYSAIYVISFFAFLPELLTYSRYIHTDIIYMTFSAIGLIFLFLFFKSEKQTKKEKLFLILSVSFFGLASATKFPGLGFIAFAGIIFLIKFWDEIKTTSNEKIKPLVIFAIESIIAFLFFFLLPFQLNPKNLIDVLKSYSTVYSDVSGFTFGSLFFKNIYNLFLNVNILDLILLIVSIYIIYKLIKNKEKTKEEKFIIYLSSWFILLSFFSYALKLFRISIPFLMGVMCLVSLVFSNKYYPLKKNRKLIFGIFIIIYLLFSVFSSLSNSPTFLNKNSLVCSISPDESSCNPNPMNHAARQISDYLKPILKEEDTFIPITPVTLTYYLNRGESLYNLQFNSQFEQQFKKSADLADYIAYYHPGNKSVRFVIINPNRLPEQKGFYSLYQEFTPTKIIKLAGKDAVYIYDLKNLSKKDIGINTAPGTNTI
ncbi:MAG: phospholipid carrier-dependent glycosyltransferase [Candidatus Nanoarchaeia archaeon]|nr:phospholipid carrier-dependent glycosyltransferase [Candidatus Nanoarchaeia archaeon]